MKGLLAATAAIALFAAPAFAADDNGMHPDSSKKTNPSVSSKNTNSDGSSTSSGNNGSSSGTSGNVTSGSSSSSPPPSSNGDGVKTK